MQLENKPNMNSINTIACYLLLVLSGISANAQSWIRTSPKIVYHGSHASLTITGTNTNFLQADSCVLRLYIPGNPVQNISAIPTVYTNTLMSVVFDIPANTWPWNGTWAEIDVMENGNVATYDSIYPISIPLNSALVQGKITRGPGTNCSAGIPMAGALMEFDGLYQNGYGSSDLLGNYTAIVPVSTINVNTFDVNALMTPAHYTWICPTQPTSIALTTSGQIIDNFDFYFQQQAVTDISATLGLNAHRPGFNSTNYVTLENIGSMAANNVVVKVYVDPSTTYLNSTPPGVFQNDTITWTLPSLAGNSWQNLYFQVNTPATVSLGTTIGYNVISSTGSSDANLLNNGEDDQIVVVGSFDPNDKQVWDQNGDNADGPVSDTNNLFRYLIRFQNTGTDTAFNIRVQDEISSYLDVSSLEVISASHPYMYSLTNGNEAEFLFPNIFLPDSNTNEPLSHGHIEFTIRRSATFTGSGFSISNRADIYFDYNYPVLTNTVNSLVCPPVDIDFNITTNINQISIANNSTTNGGSVLWDFGDGNTSNSFFPVTHSYAAPGTYIVCFNVTTICSTSTQCDTIVIGPFTGIEDGPLRSLSLYPNPNSGRFTVKAEFKEEWPLTATISDLTGKILYKEDWGMTEGNVEKHLDMNFPAGTYLLVLELNGQRIDRIFNIQK